MQLSSAQIEPICATSRHERKLVWYGVIFYCFAASWFLVESGGDEFARFAAGAAGVAFVQFAQSEAAAWRRPLTLGHQLVFWWYWPLVLPVFAIITRRRRSSGLTLLLMVPVITGLVIAIAQLLLLFG
ncbi:MAG: hypothetical protein K8R59_16605 [Thermoanaerobaculales bacterium]|nr:hypothetical protein [Thermoanaerobaculales bacterium]